MNNRGSANQIASDLRKQIQDGNFSPGHQLPSSRALMSTYGVAQQTVQNAFNQLRTEGLITSRHGAGVFVAGRTQLHPIHRTQRQQDGSPHAIDRVATRYATTDDARDTEVAPGTLMFTITRATYDEDGERRSLEHVLVPAEQHELIYEFPTE